MPVLLVLFYRCTCKYWGVLSNDTWYLVNHNVILEVFVVLYHTVYLLLMRSQTCDDWLVDQPTLLITVKLENGPGTPQFQYTSGPGGYTSVTAHKWRVYSTVYIAQVHKEKWWWTSGYCQRWWTSSLNRTHLHHRTPVGGQRLAMIDWWVDHDNNGDFEVWESAFTRLFSGGRETPYSQ